MAAFSVDSDLCCSINERISKLGVSGTVDVTTNDFAGPNLSKKLISVCSALLGELGKHDENINSNVKYKNAREVRSCLNFVLYALVLSWSLPRSTDNPSTEASLTVLQ